MINRRVTRTIYDTLETTDVTNSLTSTPLTFALLTTTYFYVGFHGHFAARYFNMNVVNVVSSVLTVEYWNGSAWTAVDDLLDQTSLGGATFGQSGFISWSNKTDWVKRSLTGVDLDVELYWVRMSVSVNLTAGCKLQSVLNLFSDNGILKAYYPELVSDTRYLPSGQTNFLPQHIAAKDLIVLRCKQRKLITDESQIIDINSVAIAAAHACAWIILSPIANTEAKAEMADAADKKFMKEIEQLLLDVDANSDGVVTEAERRALSQPFITRR